MAPGEVQLLKCGYPSLRQGRPSRAPLAFFSPSTPTPSVAQEQEAIGESPKQSDLAGRRQRERNVEIRGGDKFFGESALTSKLLGFIIIRTYENDDLEFIP